MLYSFFNKLFNLFLRVSEAVCPKNSASGDWNKAKKEELDFEQMNKVSADFVRKVGDRIKAQEKKMLKLNKQNANIDVAEEDEEKENEEEEEEEAEEQEKEDSQDDAEEKENEESQDDNGESD